MNKALELLKTNKSVKERAEVYVISIKRNIQTNTIDILQNKIDQLKDELFDLGNFTLDTNLNAGLKQMTKDDCEKRFIKIIELEYDLVLLELELKTKKETFNKYFNESTEAL